MERRGVGAADGGGESLETARNGWIWLRARSRVGEGGKVGGRRGETGGGGARRRQPHPQSNSQRKEKERKGRRRWRREREEETKAKLEEKEIKP